VEGSYACTVKVGTRTIMVVRSRGGSSACIQERFVMCKSPLPAGALGVKSDGFKDNIERFT
jgi:hypothetical protein